jgi:membrane-bound lytic murein transglycosylase D
MANERHTSFLRRRTLALACAPLLLASVIRPDGLTAQTPAAQPNAQQLAQAQQLAATQQRAQKVQSLIDQAEKSYQSGVDNYNNNRLDAARQDFDFAVDALLSSGLDLKNDPQLSDEFDQLLSKINSLEMVALKQGNGFSPTLEAAPIEAADEVTFTPNPALVSKVTTELKTTESDLPLTINDYIAGWINAYSTRPVPNAHLKASLRRAGKYKDMICKILRDNGVPQDLIYQAITESGFQPQVVNAKYGAGGMWQFLPFGNYGLVRNGYFDERFDPEKSTIAYAKYMKYLYAQFGDWYLAMAAYDWGPGRVQHLVSRTGYADFWDLYRYGNLNSETKAYIPSVIAAIIMARNPAQYGLTDIVPDAPVLSDTVTTSYAIDLKLVADITGSTVPEIVALNPAMLRLTTSPDIPYDLHIPPGTRNTYLDRLKDIPEDKRASWRFHVVKEGETLDQIAISLHARASEIAEANDIAADKPGKQIEAGDELAIPIAASSARTGQQRYTVHRGDTLITVADRFGVTAEQLRDWNNLSSNSVSPGRSIYVAEPVRLAPGTRSIRSRRGRGTTHSSTLHSSATTHSAARGTASRAHSQSKSAPSTSSKSSAKKKRGR